jgi:hypothetical protein
MANSNKTPTNKPITASTPNAPARPPRRARTNNTTAFETPERRRPTPRANNTTAFETPVRRPIAMRRLNFNQDENFRRFLDQILYNSPVPVVKTPRQNTPKAKRAKKNNNKK